MCSLCTPASGLCFSDPVSPSSRQLAPFCAAKLAAAALPCLTCPSRRQPPRVGTESSALRIASGATITSSPLRPAVSLHFHWKPLLLDLIFCICRRLLQKGGGRSRQKLWARKRKGWSWDGNTCRANSSIRAACFTTMVCSVFTC